jgi:hypothetical protein
MRILSGPFLPLKKICCQVQCCGSGMFIPDPDFYLSRISDPGSKQQKRGVKKISCHTFFCNHKFHKIEHFLLFEILKKKIFANFQRIIKLFTQKNVTMLSKIWVLDPGSRGQKGTGFRIWIRNTGQVRYVGYWTIPTIQYS